MLEVGNVKAQTSGVSRDTPKSAKQDFKVPRVTLKKSAKEVASNKGAKFCTPSELNLTQEQQGLTIVNPSELNLSQGVKI